MIDRKKETPAHGRVKQCCFTLKELLVVTSQHCRLFFKRFICTDQYGCVRKHTESAAHKNTPHHTCKASASCLPQANASCTAHNAVFASAKTYSLFLKRREGCGERGKTSFPGKRSFSSLPAAHFTLIELLVVIAIIAILAAMLMPALSQARESGRKSVCTSNQAQLIKAIHNYASDNGDYLPAYSHAKKNASEENAKRRWTYTVVSYLGYTPSDELRLPEIFLCPSFTAIPDAGSRTVTDPYAMSSYMWNNFAGYNIPGDATSGRPDPKHPYLKMNKAKLPSKFVVAAEQGIARYNYLAALGGDAGSRMFNWTGTTAKFIDFAAHVRDSNYMCLAGNVTAMRLPESARNDNGSGKDEEYYLQIFRPY